MKAAIDPYSNEEFTPKRKNQKFSSSLNRIRFNNEKAYRIRKSLDSINSALKRNYLILSQLYQEKNENIFSKEYLKGKGFSIGYCTHFKTFDGSKYPVVYFYILKIIDNNQVKIIKVR